MPRVITGSNYNRILAQTLLRTHSNEETYMTYQKTVTRSEVIRTELRKIETSFRKDCETTGVAAMQQAQALIRTMTTKAGEHGKQLKASIADARQHRDQRKQAAKKTLDAAIRAAQGTYDSTVHTIEQDFDGRVAMHNKANTDAVTPIEQEFKAADQALADKLEESLQAKRTAYMEACAPLREELAKLEEESNAIEAARLAKLNAETPAAASNG